jgi:S-adenosylmethionine synthetase
VNTYGTSKAKMSDGELAERIREIFPLKPYHIEQKFKLRTPIYEETAAYGHMGRAPEMKTKTFVSPEGREVSMTVELFPWEKLDAVDSVKAVLGLT